MVLNIREADTEEAANTAEARGRRAVDASRGIGLAPVPVAPQAPLQAVPQQAAPIPQEVPQAASEDDAFGSFVNILKNVLSLGIRPKVMAREEATRRKQAADDFNTVTTATQNMQALFGGLNKGDERTAAAEAYIGRLEQSFPGLGAPVSAAWDAVENQGVDLPAAMEHRDRALAFCGTGAGQQKCINDLFSDEKLIRRWDEEEDQSRLPEIMDRFNEIVAAANQGGGEGVLQQLSEGGWDLAELRRLPEEFAFTENQLRTINRSEEIQNSLISVGLNPASLDVKKEEAEITESTKARFREAPKPDKGTGTEQLFALRDKQLAAGNPKDAATTQAIIDAKAFGRTEEDALSANKVDEINAERRRVVDTQGVLRGLIKGIREKPSRAGLAGTASRIAQTAFGITGDFNVLGIDVKGTINALTPDFLKDVDANNVDEDVTAIMSDKSLPENTVFENQIAYSLARARKGNFRINLEDFKIAKGDVNITGLTSSFDVLSRLEAIDQEFDRAIIGFDARLDAEGASPDVELPTFELRDGKFQEVQ